MAGYILWPDTFCGGYMLSWIHFVARIHFVVDTFCGGYILWWIPSVVDTFC